MGGNYNMELRDIRVGEDYYWSPRGYYTGVIPAKIKITKIENGHPYGKIVDSIIRGSRGFNLQRVFRTEQEAKNHYQDEINTIKNNYRQQINSIEDLVQFCLDHCVACAEEYTDYDARNVAVEKAREFGMTIR